MVGFFRSGVVSTSPLKLEIQFSPVPEIQWFLMQTYVNTEGVSCHGLFSV
jgi:hypothetical protein